MWVLKFTFLKLKRAVPSAFELGEVKCGNEYMHCIMYNVNQWVVRKTRFFPHKKNSLALINKFTCTMQKKKIVINTLSTKNLSIPSFSLFRRRSRNGSFLNISLASNFVASTSKSERKYLFIIIFSSMITSNTLY